jgi:hypothetical protein
MEELGTHPQNRARDPRWPLPDRQAHEHARRNRGYERTRQQAEGGLMPDIMGCEGPTLVMIAAMMMTLAVALTADP